MLKWKMGKKNNLTIKMYTTSLMWNSLTRTYQVGGIAGVDWKSMKKQITKNKSKEQFCLKFLSLQNDAQL